MQVGVLGGTGPAGRGLAVRLADAGHDVVIGSRDADRAAEVAAGLAGRAPHLGPRLSGSGNAEVAGAELVVVATPWDGAVATVGAVAPALAGKILLSMVVPLRKVGREMVAEVVPAGSAARAIAEAAPGATVVAAFHHQPASEMEDLGATLDSDVLVCSDHAPSTAVVVALADAIPGLRGIDTGSLAQAGTVEAFTAVCITVNIRHRVHSALRLTGMP